MRLLILVTLIFCCHGSSIAAHNPSKEETVKWLRGKLTQERPSAGQKPIHQNFTTMCVNYNLHVPNRGDIDAKDFTTKIESHVSWKQDEMEVQNNIYERGKLKETYTYQIPLAAIDSAYVTNCQRNTSGNVNAYVERPIFIRVKKNTTRVGHVSFDKDGKVTSSKARQYHMNNGGDTDWESVIPIAGNWDHEADLQNSIVEAFNRLAGLNHNVIAANQ